MRKAAVTALPVQRINFIAVCQQFPDDCAADKTLCPGDDCGFYLKDLLSAFLNIV